MPRRGVSLIELLIAIGIVGCLLGIAIPAVSRARDSANRVSCQNNLSQIGLALHNYHSSNGRLPPNPAGPPNDPNNCLGWMALILPQIGEPAIYERAVSACASNPDPLGAGHAVGHATVIKTYICPTDIVRLGRPNRDRLGVEASSTSYIGILGISVPNSPLVLNGLLGFRPGPSFHSITDGQSQTLLVGERPPPDSFQSGWWYPGWNIHAEGLRGPNNGLTLGGVLIGASETCRGLKRVFGPGRTENPCDRYHLWSLHQGGANLLFADGSVRFMRYESERIVAAFASRSGGEVVE